MWKGHTPHSSCPLMATHEPSLMYAVKHGAMGEVSRSTSSLVATL
jgi:hypothetical protein